MFKEKFRSSSVVLSSDKKVETGKLKIHFLTSKYAYSFFGRALSHEKPVCVETEVFTLLTNSDVLRLRMKEGQNFESAPPPPSTPHGEISMVAFKRGKTCERSSGGEVI